MMEIFLNSQELRRLVPGNRMEPHRYIETVALPELNLIPLINIYQKRISFQSKVVTLNLCVFLLFYLKNKAVRFFFFKKKNIK